VQAGIQTIKLDSGPRQNDTVKAVSIESVAVGSKDAAGIEHGGMLHMIFKLPNTRFDTDSDNKDWNSR
jgi:hypothetical protein